MVRFLVPLIIFVILSVFLYIGLGLNPREVPSPLIGKPAPAFDLPQLLEPEKRLSNQDMLGKVWLLNVWASWCVSCRVEHPLLMQATRAGAIKNLVGLNYKDTTDAALRWLKDGGDPYTLSAVDAEGRVGIDYGVYGTPETYLIDKNGVIVHKVIGPLSVDSLQNCVLPLIRLLEQAAPERQVTREAVQACV
ncbi:MAG: DsbE family thiol:disulfide interchange protein [Pseudomonadota bacterium]